MEGFGLSDALSLLGFVRFLVDTLGYRILRTTVFENRIFEFRNGFLEGSLVFWEPMKYHDGQFGINVCERQAKSARETVINQQSTPSGEENL